MRTFLTTAAIVATLTWPAFAEGDTTGTEAQGEANGTVKASTEELGAFQGSIGHGAMAQGRILPRANAGGAASEGGFVSPLSSGMDGGNRK